MDERLGLTRTLAACIPDARDPPARSTRTWSSCVMLRGIEHYLCHQGCGRPVLRRS